MPDSDDVANADVRDVPDVPVDPGVERLIGLLWLFRHQGRVRTNDEIEERGYPDLTGEDSVGREVRCGLPTPACMMVYSAISQAIAAIAPMPLPAIHTRPR